MSQFQNDQANEKHMMSHKPTPLRLLITSMILLLLLAVSSVSFELMKQEFGLFIGLLAPSLVFALFLIVFIIFRKTEN